MRAAIANGRLALVGGGGCAKTTSTAGARATVAFGAGSSRHLHDWRLLWVNLFARRVAGNPGTGTTCPNEEHRQYIETGVVRMRLDLGRADEFCPH